MPSVQRVLGSVVISSAMLWGCTDSPIAQHTTLGLNDPCTPDDVCRPPLECSAAGACEPTGDVALGDPCVFSADCQSGYCAQGECAADGTRDEGGVCTTAADCVGGLYCAFEGFGGTCRPGGTGDIEDVCDDLSDCAAGLVCDALLGTCQVEYSPPFGDTCQAQSDCSADLGIFCDPRTDTCGGAGPDGQPIPVWTGAQDCTTTNAQEGAFRILFDISGSRSTDDFYRLPFPNDIRLEGGHIDLTGHPTPPLEAVPTDLMARIVDLIEADTVTGFGPNQSVFMRFSGSPDFCDDDCAVSASCEPGCMGPGEDAQSVIVVLLRDAAGTVPTTTASGVNSRWAANTGRTPYICWNWVALIPTNTTPFKPGNTYGVFVHTRVKNKDGTNLAQDPTFATMLQSTAPVGALAAPWAAYQPLRDWLAGNPTYTASNIGHTGTVLASDIGGAAVFTIRDPTTVVDALADEIEAGVSPTFSAFAVCDATPAATGCSDPSGQAFVELQGEVDLPIFQEGTVPFATTGGAISRDAGGVPVRESQVSVAFSLSIPKGAPPLAGWPVVIYAHGTGGSSRNHILDGTAAALADATFSGDGSQAGFAVLGIDQVAHGARGQHPTMDAELLFFNVNNPAAGRGNVLQGAADQLSLIRGLGALSAQLDAITGLDVALGLAPAGTVTLDTAQVGYLGHSQGSTVGALAMARAPQVGATVFSGAGANLLETFVSKTSPYNLPVIIRMVLADPTLSDPHHHPALSLIQGYFEEADATNYAALVSRGAMTGSIAKHTLQVVGTGDTFTPEETMMIFGRRLGASYIETTPASGLPNVTEIVAPPVRGNEPAPSQLTRVASIHAPASGDDGHFVLFDVPLAMERVAEYFVSWVTDPTHVPTVIE